MSRTTHHKNQKKAHQGEDLWSRRAGMAGRVYNAFNKWRTRRIERRQAKDALVKSHEDSGS